MTENKTTRIEIRLTEEEKQQLKEYTEQHKTTISKLIRKIIQQIIKGEKIIL